LRDGLAALGHRVNVPGDSFGFGCGQFVVRAGDGYMAGSDPRRDGYPVGY
jgi:gamma-glutamyltranspeptidase/glutathione hydrolase